VTGRPSSVRASSLPCLLAALALAGCGTELVSQAAAGAISAAAPAESTTPSAAAPEASAPHPIDDPITTWLAVDLPVADGFDPPTSSDTPSHAHAVAAGRVAAVAGPLDDRVVTIDHVYYQHGSRHTVASTYRDLADVTVQPGDDVVRGQPLGRLAPSPAAPRATSPTDAGAAVSVTPADASPYGPPPPRFTPSADFIDAHRTLFVPHDEPLVLVFHQESDSLAWVEDGRITGRYQVGWGQVRGPKEQQGDLKTPRGMYFVVAKSRGPFDGPAGPFYGGHWIKLNYPGPRDAARGLDAGWISRSTADRITHAWRSRALTLQNTRLGGGIGLHGWITEWDDASTRLRSWGCIVLHNRDIAALYDEIPIGTMVVVLD